MITAKWILILMLTTTDCGGIQCSEGVAMTQVNGFETKEACLAAGTLAQSQFSDKHYRKVRAICAATI